MSEERHVELSVNLAGAVVLGVVFSFIFSGGERGATLAELIVNFAQGFGAYAAAALFAKKYHLDDPGRGVVPLAGSLLVAACFFTLHAGPSESLASAALAFAGMFAGWTALSAVVISLAHACAWLARKFDLFSVDA